MVKKILNQIKDFFKKNYVLIIFSIVVAIIAHSYFIYKHINYEHIMVGTGDQTSQMILFKDYLYKQFTDGNFFFNFTFNGGGNFFTSLSYYYSTSMMYYLTVLVTYILETIGILTNVGVSYWANSIIVISIFRSSLILVITTKLIGYFQVNKPIAFFASTFYAVSVIYFRHVVLWEFFADAMIWLPILFLGVEKIINRESGIVFSLGVFLTMFNNGYFAYKNFIFLFVYIVLRFFVKFSDNEDKVVHQLKRYLIYGVLGAVMSLPGFIPFVLGFINTSRLSPEFNIPLTNFQLSHLTGFLFTDNAFIIPALFMVLVFTFYLYKNKKFRLFSLFSIVLIILRYNPMIGSITNGFSYPQYRWMYVLYLLISITIGVGVQLIYDNLSNKVLNKNLLLSSGINIIIYLFVFYYSKDSIEYSFIQLILFNAMTQILLIVVAIYWQKMKLNNFIIISIILSLLTIFTSNRQLYYEYGLRNRPYFIEKFDEPENKYQQVLDFIETDAVGFYRIDFFEGSNFSLPFEVSTLNLYSSFQNKNQQQFERSFQVLSDYASNGEFSGLGKRKVLNSLFQVNYVIAPSNQTFRVPVGYENVATFEDLNIYKNDTPLEFIHPVRNIYESKNFSNETFKDELILDALITDDLEKTSILKNNQSLIHELSYRLEYQNIQHQGDIISVDEDNQLVIDIETPVNPENTIILEYTLEPVKGNLTTEYHINDYKIELKGAGLAYSEQRFRHRIPLDNENQIILKLEGNNDYHFKVHNIHVVSEDAMEKRIAEEDEFEYNYEIKSDSVRISYNNDENYPFMVLPIFSEMGWELQVNGVKADILNVNYGMIGFEIPVGDVEIELKFKQPLLIETISLATGAFILLIVLENKRRTQIIKKNNSELV